MRRFLAAAIAAPIILTACGDADPARTVTVTELRTATVTVEVPPPARTEPPIQGSVAPVSRASYRPCDPNISAKAGTTTCAFALNAFYEYWRSGMAQTISVHSPALGRRLRTTCAPDGEVVRCSTSDGGVARFPIEAVLEYTEADARAFASSHELEPPQSRSGEPGDEIDELMRDLAEATTGDSLDDLDLDAVDQHSSESGSGQDGRALDLPDLGSSRVGAPSAPGFHGLNRAGFPRNQYVRPHFRSDGTYVGGYWRNSPHDAFPTCRVIRC